LLRYITDAQREHFQPMNVNFGLIPPLTVHLRGKAKKEMLSRRALADMAAWLRETKCQAKDFTADFLPILAPAVSP
jgi:methylenetetrahydrofolate--tRNA-(uracil-5-)-methyltransferase